jgi:hypothetical protein
MFDLNEIEELLKSEEFMKALNRRQLDMFFHNTNLLKDPNITPEMKAQAQANIKAIISPEAPKPREKKPKAEKQPKLKAAPIQQEKPVELAKPANVANIKLKYHPVYEHYGVTQDHWNNAAPDAHQELFNFHNEVMAGKHPGAMHIKNAIEAKMKKSIDRIYDNLYKISQTLK